MLLKTLIMTLPLFVVSIIIGQALFVAGPVTASHFQQIGSPVKEYAILEYKYPWPPYDFKPAWHSAMAQAQAMQVLLKAYNLTSNQKYLAATNDLINAFFVNVENGGLTYKTQNNGWWYELYADPAGKHPKVLNGMLWTLISLYDYYANTKDLRAKYLFNQGIISLKNNLGYYDGGNFTYYDIYKQPAKLDYHETHVKLLGQIYNITKDSIFKTYYEKWAKYDVSSMQHQKPLPTIKDYLGIPIVDYGVINGTYIGPQRNIVVIDHAAQDFYDLYIQNKDLHSRQFFLNNANWLIEHMVRRALDTNVTI